MSVAIWNFMIVKLAVSPPSHSIQTSCRPGRAGVRSAALSHLLLTYLLKSHQRSLGTSAGVKSLPVNANASGKWKEKIHLTLPRLFLRRGPRRPNRKSSSPSTIHTIYEPEMLLDSPGSLPASNDFFFLSRAITSTRSSLFREMWTRKFGWLRLFINSKILSGFFRGRNWLSRVKNEGW